MPYKMLRISTVVAIVLAFAACGNGETTPNNGETSSKPEVERLKVIVEQSNAVLSTGRYVNYSFASFSALPDSGSYWDVDRCLGSRCVASSGLVTTVSSVVDPSTVESRGELDKRGGLDTVFYWRPFQAALSLPAYNYPALPRVRSYGMWGDHGYASIDIMKTQISVADVLGHVYSGSLNVAAAYAVGDNPETNPRGIGSATWRGIAEAASTRSFERRQGTSTITIPDLSLPRVDVTITISGVDISLPDWKSMSPSQGHYYSATQSGYISGDFYGPNHEETFGVFETGIYVGAFGAKRQ